MKSVSLSLGSNQQARTNIVGALDALHEDFGDLLISSVYESEPVGFNGANFLNLVVVIDTDKELGQLSCCLKNLEDKFGRKRDAPRFSGRTLDIDILTCDQMCGVFFGIKLPRDEITENAYVLRPLAEICADGSHPLSGKKYSELWNEYDKKKQKLWPVDFNWHGSCISKLQGSGEKH